MNTTRNRLLLPLLTVGLLGACGGSTTTVAPDMVASIDLSVPPEPSEPRPYELPAVEETTLDNGLKITWVDRPEFPTLSVRLGLRAGRAASPDQIAVPEMVARLLREGTEARDGEAISLFIDSSGLSYSASVGMESLTMAVDGLASQGPQMADLLADLLQNATFPEDRVEAKREEYLGELQLSVAQPGFHRSRLSSRVLFGEHVYGSTIEPDDVSSFTRDQLVAFYESFFGPNRAQLVVVGDITDEARRAIEESLGAWSAETVAWEPAEVEPVQACNVAHVVVRPNSAQTAITWMGPAVGQKDDTYFPTLVANEILGGGIIGRLFLILREERSYTYGAYSGLRELPNASWFSASSDVRSDVTSEAVATFLEIFNTFQTDALPEGDLTNNISYLSGVFPIELATNGALSGTLLSLYFSDLDAPRFLEDYRGALAEVSLEATEEAARTLINPSNLALVMVGEEQAVIPAAVAHTSLVHIYDLDGNLVETRQGDQASTCTDAPE